MCSDVPGLGFVPAIFVGPDPICGKQSAIQAKAGGALFLGHGPRAAVLHPQRAAGQSWTSRLMTSGIVCCPNKHDLKVESGSLGHLLLLVFHRKNHSFQS